jgi:uracil-DNA glycosylase
MTAENDRGRSGPIVMSPFQAHCERWKKGCGAAICKRARQVVFYRGDIPCDVLLIGEAPGASENARGWPFCGPAGILLDRMIAKALDLSGERVRRVRIGITNVVGCIPRDEEGVKVEQPEVEDVEHCTPRLQEIVRIADGYYGPAPEEPKRDRRLLVDTLTSSDVNGPNTKGRIRVIITVGRVATDWLDPKMRGTVRFHRDIPQVEITHPAALLGNRMPIAQKGLAERRNVVLIKGAIEKYVLGVK